MAQLKQVSLIDRALDDDEEMRTARELEIRKAEKKDLEELKKAEHESKAHSTHASHSANVWLSRHFSQGRVLKPQPSTPSAGPKRPIPKIEQAKITGKAVPCRSSPSIPPRQKPPTTKRVSTMAEKAQPQKEASAKKKP